MPPGSATQLEVYVNQRAHHVLVLVVDKWVFFSLTQTLFLNLSYSVMHHLGALHFPSDIGAALTAEQFFSP